MSTEFPSLSPENPLRCANCSELGNCNLETESSEQRQLLASFLGELQNLVSRGGPEPSEYERITSGLQHLDRIMGSCGLRQRHVCRIREALGSSLSLDSMQGLALHKPYGYAGDFEIIDRMYTQRVSADPHLARWDRFYHHQQCATAVRNRKTYFKNLIHEFVRKNGSSARSLRVLDVASGPARDLYEYFSEEVDPRVYFDCIETDTRAIQYATDLCGPFIDRITFHQVNALRFMSSEKFDLVWSAGLFDYFNDRLFVRLLNRLAKSTREGAELVIGNFGDQHESRSYMELVGEWHLHHRSEECLTALALQMTPPPQSVTVEKEPSGLNLFLRIRTSESVG